MRNFMPIHETFKEELKKKTQKKKGIDKLCHDCVFYLNRV